MNTTQVNHYHNPHNGRAYCLALSQDLLGDWTVCKFCHIECQRDAAQAQRYFQVEHRRRLARGYQQASETV